MSARLFLFLRLTLVALLIAAPAHSSAAKATQCEKGQEFLSLLFGSQSASYLTDKNPFGLLSKHPDAQHILWVTPDTSTHGMYKVQQQGLKGDITIISASCAQLTSEMKVVIRALRTVVNSEMPLAPGAHFIDDMGLSFDQIIELQTRAFELAEKTEPDDLFENMHELAGNIADAPPLVKSRSVGEKEFHVQTVYYSTTRSPDSDSDRYYGGLRDTEQPLHMGEAKVSIPKNHQKGQVEQPFLSIKWLKQANNHVLIQSVNEMSPDEFWKSLPVDQGSGEWEQSIIVYIHGYNVAFDSAIKRTAQMAYDFDYSGVPVLFSWPSNASLIDYASDREDAIWSATYLAQFLTSIDSRFPDSRIHIVAHSMGNQVLLNAMNELSLREDTASLKFGSVILAAPDVDSEWFKYQLAPRISRLAVNWAVYTSENDGALMASEKVNQAKRLGMPVSIVDNFDIVDTSDLNAAPWSIPESHSYYANKLPVIEDLVDHLRGIPPAERELVKTDDGNGVYWRITEEE